MTQKIRQLRSGSVWTWLSKFGFFAGLLETKQGDDSSDSDSEAADDDDQDRQQIPGLNMSKASAKSSKLTNQPQTEVLYSEANQFNPALARAEKKRQKKAKKLSLGDDFNFVEAFADEVKMDDDEEEEDEDDDDENDEVEKAVESESADTSDSDWAT